MPRAVFLFLSLLLSAQSVWSADGRSDYDLDDDGLIEINDWSDLDEVRNNLDGASLYGSSTGCPADGCIGFELTTDLNFDTNGDGTLDSGDVYWNTGEGWQPIGSSDVNAFTGIFHGNGHLIRNLMIARPNARYQGLFGNLDNATVKELGLTGPLMAIEGDDHVGGLAGYAGDSQITAVFVSGYVTGTDDNIGGLVGRAGDSAITASYVTGSVRGEGEVGGLVGRGHGSDITASLSTAYVSANSLVGGLIGFLGSVSASYWAEDASGQTSSDGGGTGVTLAELQCPTSADDTACADATLYADWSSYKDDQGNAYWDFGSATQLPGLRLQGSVYRDGDGDGAQDTDDPFPAQFAGGSDSDGDGAIDHWTLACDADCRDASDLILDQLPNNAAASVDADLDGLPDQWSDGCDSACQSASGLTLDSVPNDTDNDGISNEDDNDDNSDGIVDADADSNGLIDVGTMAELDAIRYSLAGAGQRLSAEGELNTSGCPQVPHNGVLQARCHGYELTADLDFDTNGDGVLDGNDAYWNEGEGWQPIGSGYDNAFTGIFHGNGHLVRNLMITRPNARFQSLFGNLDNATVKELGLTGPFMAIEGDQHVGGLAGYARNSEITAVFVSGSVTGTGDRVGGLVATAADCTIIASYATGAVRSGGYLGGLVGYGSGSDVVASLSTAYVSGERAYTGGLIARSGSVIASYWAEDASGQTESDGGTGATLAELQCPTSPDNTACADATLYKDWSSYKDAQGNAYWDFGSATELPGLRLRGRVHRDGDGDGVQDADDALPVQFAASVDSDGDGAIDRWTLGCDTDCREESSLVLDQFPDTAAAILDADWDGLPDKWTDHCDSTCQSASGLTLDSALNDTDNDGIDNLSDDDDNNDGVVDADADSDGLIEIGTLAELDAVRHGLTGAGQRLEAEDELDNSGCPHIVYKGVLQKRCRGYELTADLNFDTNGDDVIDSNDTYWNGGEGWQPIGSDWDTPFTGVFHGNGHVIRNLMIARRNANYQGLFGNLGNATIKELGLTGPLMMIEGSQLVGALAGYARNSQIIATFVNGSVTGTDNYVGGLVGSAREIEISASYVTGSVSGNQTVGGLLGITGIESVVNASVSSAHVSGRYSGGLSGSWGKDGIPSYWATDASGQISSGGGTGLTLAELKCPTGADDTSCTDITVYEGWSNHKDAQGNPYWDFGSATQLPGLRLQGKIYRDGDGDGVSDNDDDYPGAFAASRDSDGDGFIDHWTLGCDADCRSASGLVLDHLPDSAAASVDVDQDGLPDQWNEGCDSACQFASSLTLDDAPDDTDNDGITNQTDTDDNGDGVVDADANSNGLIDVGTLAELNAMRYSLSGAGLRSREEGTLNASGCPRVVVNGVLQERCHGYELTADLNFDTNGDGVLDSEDTYWNEGKGWLPIGNDYNNAFTGILHGNGHIIRNLIIARPDASNQGLFGYIRNTTVQELGLAGPLMTVEGRQEVGGLAGSATDSRIKATFVSGTIIGTDDFIGGLVGDARESEISANYVTGSVSGNRYVGGLLGDARSSVVSANVSTAHVSGAESTGGFVGSWVDGSANYWATDVSGQISSGGGTGGGTGLTLAELKCPTGADNTSCADITVFEGWSNHKDAQGNPYWDFGSTTEMPRLHLQGKIHRDGDGDGAQDAYDAFPAQFAASVDGDGDGLPDVWLNTCDSACQAASGLTLDTSLNDTDNDGVVNDEDAFVDNAAASVDADNDGLPDAWLDSCDSACQSASGLTLDTSLNDTDNDGVVNDEDAFVDNAAASVDTDGDGLPDAWLDSCDSACQSASGLTLDDDNDDDGVVNEVDAFPIHAAASMDADSDGLPDAWLDTCDSTCQSASGLTLDRSLNDTDNDGVVNDEDAFIDNAAASVDTDGDGLPDAWLDSCDSACQSASGLTLDDDNNDDGVANEVDAFPIHAAASVDTDGDGLPDAWLDTCDSACQSASGLMLDDDNDDDGVANEADAFPIHAAASVDADNDGLPDAWLDTCDSACQTASGLTLDASLNDTDNDGVVNDEDAFVDNAAASVDTDGDGLPDAWLDSCDSACQSASGLTLDDDNDDDGVANEADAFPVNSAASVDADSDGLPDAWLDSCDSACQSASGLTLDTSLNDTDNDGVVNDEDAFVDNAAASVDADNDGLPDAWLDTCDSACQSESGLTLDTSLNDTDNDGVVNSEDAYPTDPDRAEDEDAPEMASVPDGISVAATGETTLVTLDVVQAQAHDNFDDQLDYQVELDGEVLVRNAEQQVSLPSGALTLDWVAVDDAGNRSEPMAQTVKVYPLVRFSLSESVTGEQNLAEVAVSLSGPSPEYPVAVLVDWIEADSDATAADVVTEGENGVDLANLGLIIESADALENAVLEIPVAADDEVEPDEYFTLELNSAWAGEDEPFAMPIDEDHQRHRMTFTDTNIAPTAEVSAVQAGEPGSVFITDAGEVTVTAEVTDVNGGDSHSYQWYTDELPVTPGDQASFTFDPQVMSQGDYSIRVVVTDDGNPMLSSDEVTFEFTLEEADVPDDGGNDDGGSEDGDSDDGDSDGGQDSGGGQNPPSTGGGSSGGSSGGSINLWLLCLLTL
uniref:hypothetical protein n=1 Tax=Microbulbifer sp. TaxID=1908541 RepID=UPI0025861816